MKQYLSHPKIAQAVIAISFGISGVASATVITFEGQANLIYDTPIVRSGFLIGNVAGDEQHFHEIDSTQYGLASNGTGVLLNDRDTRIFVENEFGSSFWLGSVDVAASFSNNPGYAINVEGFLHGSSVGTVSTVFGNSFITLSGLSLGAVDRLVFDGIGDQGGFELDNLTLTPSNVPVPAAAWLLGSGLLGLIGVARRKV